jgi:hypothetical protein
VAQVKENLDYRGTTEELLEQIASGSAHEDTLRSLRDVQAERALSVEAVFHEDMGRPVKPLDSAEVIKGSEHKEPQRVVQDKDRDALTEAIGRGLALAMKELGLAKIETVKPKN